MTALVEIAIVLCSMFLVALPGIAAEQNQASKITTASEDDYVLGIYGNANEDDTIDMRDLTYVKLIFFGKKPETELADAKYDGKINPLDFIQIKLMIVGKEKELTIVDSVKRAKTFNLPINRLIALDDGNGEALKILGAGGMVVGVGTGVVTHPIVLPEMSKLPTVGGSQDLDYEKVLSLKPDLFFTYGVWPVEEIEEKLESLGIQVLRLDCLNPTTIVEDIIKLGYLLGKKDEAEEFAEFHNGYLDGIKSRTEGLSEDEKPQVYLECFSKYRTASKGSKHHELCTLAGGSNIAANILGPKDYPMFPFMDAEWVIEQNPAIIVKTTSKGGYSVDDATKMDAVRVEIMNRPELANVNAVKNGNVYILDNAIALSGQQGFVCIGYMAKWFHPDLFEDLDPKAIHQEYIDRFLRIDYDLDKHGVFVYPEPS